VDSSEKVLFGALFRPKGPTLWKKDFYQELFYPGILFFIFLHLSTKPTLAQKRALVKGFSLGIFL
jgi:hypothetical protein